MQARSYNSETGFLVGRDRNGTKMHGGLLPEEGIDGRQYIVIVSLHAQSVDQKCMDEICRQHV